MNPITHALSGWCLAEAVPALGKRDRAIVVAAAIAPDLDAFGMLPELLTRDSRDPLLWWTEYHHTLAHNLLFACIAAAIGAIFAESRNRARLALLAFAAVHLHLLEDVIGSRGPDGFQWPIPYLFPFSDSVSITWDGQWALNAWQNFAITIALLIATFILAWSRGYSPLGLISQRADAAFVQTLRRRVVGVVRASGAPLGGGGAPEARTTPLTDAQRALAVELERDVRVLCARGTRNVWAVDAMQAAAGHIESSLVAVGYAVERQRYEAGENLIAEIRGGNEIVIIGAHYDSVDGSPGADDNASGVAATLAIARRLANTRPKRTLRFVFFANEEPPHFQTVEMGSWQYAKRCHERGENIVAMFSMEMLGYYNDARGSQQYPPVIAALYPDTGDFVGFAANLGSRALVKRCVASFRKHSQFPVEGAALPEIAAPQIGWSDQWAFWHFGWPALMVTDTALFRNPNYHMPSDAPETLNYESFARVVDGLAGVVSDLANP